MADSVMASFTDRANLYSERLAIVDQAGTYTYAELIEISSRVAATLLGGRGDLAQERVAFLVSPGFAWAAVLWGIRRAGGVAVPLPMNTPSPELQYFLDDAQPVAAVYDHIGLSVLKPLASAADIQHWNYAKMLRADAVQLPRIDSDRRAMILYTSGTTSRPKGVVTTHANIAAQVTTLIEVWEWSQNDRILLCLPLHHVHGIINVVSCALWSGAVCEMLPRFDAEEVWDRIARGELTLFMGVPTIYVRLIAAWEAASAERRKELSKAASRLRLMVSGSAALPVSTLERWKEITGQTLLERYGMTEIGMALSNPYRGERIPGSVGTPLPNVEVRVVSEDGQQAPPGTAGEIEVRGPNVFEGYWNRPDATRQAFRDGWFRTGDTAVVENGAYRILGRSNIDIIKTGGHKVSALEIEEALRTHPAIAECAVVGVADAEWGERVGAAVILRENHALHLEELRAWCKERIADHKAPSRLLTVETLPRNAMGKVIKAAVADLFRQPE